MELKGVPKMLNRLKSTLGLLIVGLSAITIMLVLNIYPEYLWFDSFKFSAHWWFVFKTKVSFFSIGFLVSFIWLSLNFKIVQKYTQRPFQDHLDFNTPFAPFNAILKQLWENARKNNTLTASSKLNTWITRLGILALSILFGLTFRSNWDTILAYLNQSPTGSTDPLFGYDLAFYFFTLPLLNTLHGWLTMLMVLSIGIIGWTYFSKNILFVIFSQHKYSPNIRRHVGSLLAIFIALIGVGTYLGGFDLLYSQEGVVFGAGYTDTSIHLPVKYILTTLWFLEAILVLAWAFNASLTYAVIGLALIVIMNISGGKVIPGIVQNYIVAPNEMQKEKPYIEHNINYTRKAYGLDKISTRAFPVKNNLSIEKLEKNEETLRNIRLWNAEPLKQTFSQLQEIRLYYEFANIDVDRYTLNGKLQQVMLSSRELDVNQLSSQAQTWINRHLVYTHGYGACLSPVNEITPEGLPIFYMKDLPPVSSIDQRITRPEIYFGERTNEYAIVNTKQKEFDYPKGDSNVYTNYEGQGGIPLDSIFKRALFAFSLSDMKIFVSNLITNESRLLINRNITTITRRIAPFLEFDKDPYLVITEEGRMIWVQDAYTSSSKYPYSEPFYRDINYIRNSVKITIDAYSGDTNFYIIDQEDPIIKTYAKMFPNFFKTEIPSDIKSHIRYPKDLFTIQSLMLRTYHMTDPQVFYNREDLWAIPKEKYGESEQVMKPYYMVTKLPDEDTSSFVLMLPFTPTNKNNMISWMAVNCDGDNYGKATLFTFPKEGTIYGPMQIESRIDQDTEISQKLTLWGQVGSRVIRGNLMVVPIEESLIYVEPIYLQATQSKLPELKRVIFGYDDTIVMEKDLPSAMGTVFNQKFNFNKLETVTKKKGLTVTNTSSVTQKLLSVKASLEKIKNQLIKELSALETLLKE
jgi:uncharacterized protein